jgi:hypothetical protein
MQDITILETCDHCGSFLTLMESINTNNNKTYLVKRCLACHNFPVTEIVEIVTYNM